MWIEYKDGKPDQFLHSEGSVRMDKDEQFKYYFVLRDHLGNTRVTFADLNNDDEINEKEEIIQINNYYAFGLNMEGNWNGAAGANKYQYNGKEWQDDLDLGWNDYGARFYDPAIARWTTIDPLAEMYVDWSPYNYVANNPIKYIDPDGMCIGSAQPPAMGDSPEFRQLFREFVSKWDQAQQTQEHSRAQAFFSPPPPQSSKGTPVPFSTFWANYSDDSDEIGHIDPSTKKDVYDHACAIRLSHSLNKSGVTLKGYKGNKCTSYCPLGGKGKHALGATDMANWLRTTPFSGLGKAENITGEDFASKINNRTGIIYFEDYWQRETEKGDVRTGDHIDLWNQGTLGTDGKIISWIRIACPPCGLVIGRSNLGKSKKILFFEIR